MARYLDSLGAVHGGSMQATRFIRIAKALLSVVMAMMLGIFVSVPAKAHAAQDPYTYTVKLYAGAQGTFKDGTDRLVYKDLQAGTILSFHQGDVELDNEQKYYVRGWKLSGRDNDTTSELLSALTVTKDLDLVVSYGILGENVGYTVEYIDLDGTELYPSEHFYGNIGESPMLAYRYIEGYTPQAYNLTGELLADESQNVYTFVYTPIPVAEEPTVVAPETPAAPATTPAPATATPTPAPAAADAPATAVEPAVTDIPDEAAPAAPAIIEDIRDDENPLASGVEDGMFSTREVSDDAFPSNALVIISIVGLVLLAGLIVGLILFMRKRKKDRDSAMKEARLEILSNGQGAAVAQQPSYFSPNAGSSGNYPGQFQ